MSNEQMIDTLHESMRDMVREFLEKAGEAGYDLRITHAYRSIDEQNALYAQGRTKPGAIVTNAKGGQSFHNFSLAIDVVDKQLGYEIDWKKLGEIGESVGLEHGDRGFTDLPHFQYRGGLSLEQVQQGQRPAQEQLTEQDMKEIDDLNARVAALETEVQRLKGRKWGRTKVSKFVKNKLKRTKPKK